VQTLSLFQNSYPADDYALNMGTFTVFSIIWAIMYLLPSFIANHRSMPNKGSTIVVNVFLGWTVIGWVVAMAMACGNNKKISQ